MSDPPACHPDGLRCDLWPACVHLAYDGWTRHAPGSAATVANQPRTSVPGIPELQWDSDASNGSTVR
jgi:hypothetical protein